VAIDPAGIDLRLGDVAYRLCASHEVPFLIEDGQIVGRLVYERLITRPDKLYGTTIGSSYQRQGLALSKHFKPFAPR
jgi:dCTP deaminase